MSSLQGGVWLPAKARVRVGLVAVLAPRWTIGLEQDIMALLSSIQESGSIEGAVPGSTSVVLAKNFEPLVKPSSAE